MQGLKQSGLWRRPLLSVGCGSRVFAGLALTGVGLAPLTFSAGHKRCLLYFAFHISKASFGFAGRELTRFARVSPAKSPGLQAKSVRSMSLKT